MHQALVLDSQIRDFVFIPLILMQFLVGILRYGGRDIMMGRGKKEPEALKITKDMLENDELIDFDAIQDAHEGDDPDNNAISRSNLIRAQCNHLPAESIKLRKAYFCNKDSGFFRKEKTNNPLQAMMNPDMMMGMMKGQFFMMAFNIGMFSIVGMFFSGFVNAKMPFPLAQSFR